MKRSKFIIYVIIPLSLIIIVLIGYGVCTYISEYRRPTSIFSDTRLETYIRELIGKPYGEIHPEDCSKMRKLDLSSIDSNTSLEGLQYFENLVWLSSQAGEIRDISALANLKKLKYLDLYKNRISDISPLKGLDSLEYLSVYDNRVVSIDALSSLSSLKHLDIGKNCISDLSPLESLSNLEYLIVNGGCVDNIEVLHGNTRLEIQGLDNVAGKRVKIKS